MKHWEEINAALSLKLFSFAGDESLVLDFGNNMRASLTQCMAYPHFFLIPSAPARIGAYFVLP